MTTAEFTARRPIPGYRVVATCFLLAVYAWGLGFYGLSVYIRYLGEGVERTPALLSAATTFYFVLGAVAMAMLERLAARFRWRDIATAGVLLMSASAVALAWTQSAPALFLAYATLACGWATCSGTAISQIIGRWFFLRRGLALSLALTGASFGGILVVPLFTLAIDALGAQRGIAWTAAGLALLVLPLVRVNLVEPRDADGTGAPSVAPAPHSAAASSAAASSTAAHLCAGAAATTSDRPLLLQVCALFAIGWFAQVSFLALQIPILAPRIGAVDAAAAVSLTTAAAIAGRLALGAVVDRVGHRWLTAASFLLQAAGMGVLLASESRAAAWAGCAMFGFSVGNVITLPAVFAQHEFDRARYGVVIARVWTAGQLVFAFGPMCAGYAMQASGAAWPVMAGCAACQVVAALLCARIARPVTPARPSTPTATQRSSPAAS